MKKVILSFFACGGLLVLATNSSALSAGNDSTPKSASGSGTFSFGDDRDGDGVAYFQFTVEKGEKAPSPEGSLLLGAEDHHSYPDIIIRMNDIRKVQFSRESVSFTGKGKLHDEPVTVSIRALDGQPSERSDHFSVRAVTSDGKVLFEAEGDLSSGDIIIGEVD